VIVECVVNLSEGRNVELLSELASAPAVSPALLDVHRDPHHHRSVFTLAGPPPLVVDAVRSLATLAVDRLDISTHDGVHPRLGVLDVVPFVPYEPGRLPPQDLSGAVLLRDEFAAWLAADLGVPAFLYGPLSGDGTRALPDIRRQAFAGLTPDFGPTQPHPTAGASAVGARSVLVAYNVWVSSPDVALTVAKQVRGPYLRALGLAVGDRAQVSCNLIDPAQLGPAQAYDSVATRVEAAAGDVLGAELVGLVPDVTLRGITSTRWPELDLSEDRTVEARLERAGLISA